MGWWKNLYWLPPVLPMILSLRRNYFQSLHLDLVLFMWMLNPPKNN